MNPVVIYPDITLLLINQSDEEVQVQFAESTFSLPKIGQDLLIMQIRVLSLNILLYEGLEKNVVKDILLFL